MKEREFTFHVGTPPSEELIAEFHRSIAKSLIFKFGEYTMKEVLRVMEENKKAENKQ